ncbi:MAG: hypothetical protein M0R05_04190 [Bacilli bacterium]|nr:hypothetical protein [Bacilli bacterium]MDD4077446.1 hypothetical protein [Bacilli bacterium]MDD4388734.1 hypothetical protein [Bacilli bacterium]
MITKIEKLDVFKNDSKSVNRNYLYSQIIKNERHKRKLTLQEMAHGICSISYLCKLERNAIVADESYIKAIFERVNLDFEKVGLNIIENGVKKIIKAYLYQNYSEIAYLYEMIDDSLFNVQNHLIKGFYYLINQKYQDFKNTIATIDIIKETMLKEDIGVFMFLVIEYYLQTYQFKPAYKYLKFLENNDFDNQELNWLIYEQHYICAYNLKIYPKFYRYYKLLMGNYNIGYPSTRQILIRLMMLDVQAIEYFSEIVDDIRNIIANQYDDAYYLDITYWKFLILLRGKLWYEVYEEIIKAELFGEARFIGLLLYAADRLKRPEYIKRSVEIAENYIFESNETIHQVFINFMLLKFKTEKKYTLIEHLRFKVIPFNRNYTHHLYNKIYEKHYIEYLCKTSKYKEALTYYRR